MVVGQQPADKGRETEGRGQRSFGPECRPIGLQQEFGARMTGYRCSKQREPAKKYEAGKQQDQLRLQPQRDLCQQQKSYREGWGSQAVIETYVRCKKMLVKQHDNEHGIDNNEDGRQPRRATSDVGMRKHQQSYDAVADDKVYMRIRAVVLFCDQECGNKY